MAVTISAYAVFSIIATEWRTEFRRQLNVHDNEVSAQTVDSLINYELSCQPGSIYTPNVLWRGLLRCLVGRPLPPQFL
jgi:hypothetical protein